LQVIHAAKTNRLVGRGNVVGRIKTETVRQLNAHVIRHRFEGQELFVAHFKKEGRENPLDSIFADANDAKMARRLALPIFERAAVLTAVHLAAFVIKTGEGADPAAPVAINADGSTYYKTRAVPFAATVVKELDDMLVKRRNIHYEITPMVEDAPMVGAGIAAML
jgi:hypothetical protein